MYFGVVWYDAHSVMSEQVCVCEGQADSMLTAFEVLGHSSVDFPALLVMWGTIHMPPLHTIRPVR